MPRAAFEASTLLGFTAKKVSSVVVYRSDTAAELPTRGTTVGTACVKAILSILLLCCGQTTRTRKRTTKHDALLSALSVHRRIPAFAMTDGIPCSLSCKLPCKYRPAQRKAVQARFISNSWDAQAEAEMCGGTLLRSHRQILILIVASKAVLLLACLLALQQLAVRITT